MTGAEDVELNPAQREALLKTLGELEAKRWDLIEPKLLRGALRQFREYLDDTEIEPDTPTIVEGQTLVNPIVGTADLHVYTPLTENDEMSDWFARLQLTPMGDGWIAYLDGITA